MMYLNKTAWKLLCQLHVTNFRSKNKQNINFSTRSIIITGMHVFSYKTEKLFIRNIP